MNAQEIQQKCNEFLQSIGIPGFIVLGLQKDATNCDVVYSMKDMPVKAAVQGMTAILHDMSKRL